MLEYVLSVFVLLEVFSLYYTKMFLIHKLLLLPRIIYQINKMKSPHWKLNFSFFRILQMKKTATNEFGISIDFKSIFISDDDGLKVNKSFFKYNIIGRVLLNRWGKVTYTILNEQFQKNDENLKDKIIQKRREETLDKLGL